MAVKHIPYKNEHRVYTFAALASEFLVVVSCLLIVDLEWVWLQNIALIHFNHYALISETCTNRNPV